MVEYFGEGYDRVLVEFLNRSAAIKQLIMIQAWKSLD